MANYKKYNIFIFLSTVARNIFEIFSSVFLYKMGYNLKEIMLFYFILYFTAILVNYISLKLLYYINGRWILIFSSLLFSYSFYYLINMDNNITNLIIFSIINSIASYTYHSLRHYFAIEILPKDNKQTSTLNILIFTYIALIFAPYIGAFVTEKYEITVTVILSLVFSILGIIPILKLDIKKQTNKKIKLKQVYKKMPKNKIKFFILEQFKVIFLSLQPLYLYLNISSKLEYIGIFNIILGIASLIFIYIFIKKINLNKYFIYLNIMFIITLLFKINILNKNILLVIAFFEGLFLKMYETVSLTNIYNKDKNNVIEYLIICEIIFCLTRSIICLACIFILDLKLILYLMIFGILLSGFVKVNEKQKAKVSVKQKLKDFAKVVAQNKNRERIREKHKDRGQSL